ncbi:hypothetical protein PkoCFBP13504_15540 [Pseudomonas koreensis]|nr:hypothetical protein PkoCFBP13504_15540 [Pseudomonas koreensis]
MNGFGSGHCLERCQSVAGFGGLASRSGPHPSPLPEGEGADRGVLRDTSTWKILVIMVLVILGGGE